MWFAQDVARHRRALLVELKAEHGAVAVAVDTVLEAHAKEQNDEGCIRDGFAAIAQEAGCSKQEARAFMEEAAQIGWLDDLVVDEDGRRFTVRVSGWKNDQDAAQSAWRGEHGDASDAAVDLLAALLGDGQARLSREVRQCAESEGVAWRTMQRAAKRAGVVVERSGVRDGHGTTWRLPLAPLAPLAPSWRDSGASDPESGEVVEDRHSLAPPLAPLGATGASQQARGIEDAEAFTRATAPPAHHSTVNEERVGAREREPDMTAAADDEHLRSVVEVLRSCPRLTFDLELLGVSHVLAAFPNGDAVRAAHIAVSNASDPNYRTTDAAKALRYALNELEVGEAKRSRHLAPVGDRDRERKVRDEERASIARLMNNTEGAA
jgi:hypothetical protein